MGEYLIGKAVMPPAVLFCRGLRAAWKGVEFMLILQVIFAGKIFLYSLASAFNSSAPQYVCLYIYRHTIRCILVSLIGSRDSCGLGSCVSNEMHSGC